MLISKTKHVFVQLSGNSLAGQLGRFCVGGVSTSRSGGCAADVSNAVSRYLCVFYQVALEAAAEDAEEDRDDAAQVSATRAPSNQAIVRAHSARTIKVSWGALEGCWGDPCGAACPRKQLSGHTLARQLEDSSEVLLIWCAAVCYTCVRKPRRRVFDQLSGRTLPGQLGGSWVVLFYQQSKAEAAQPTRRMVSVAVFVYSTRWLWKVQRKVARKTAKMRHRCQLYLSPKPATCSANCLGTLWPDN